MTVSRLDPKASQIAAHERFVTSLADTPAWLATLRDRSLQRFAAVGFPTTRDEDWRLTSVQPLLERDFRDDWTAPPPLTAADAAESLAFAAGPRLVFVDGWFSEALSVTAGLPPGVRAESLARAVQHVPELVRPYLADRAVIERNAFAALGSAFLADGAFLHVPAKTRLAQPINVVYLATGRRHVIHPHTLAVLEREADVTIVEAYAGLDTGDYFTNAVTEVVLGDGARARHYRIQREHGSAFHIATNHWTLGRDAALESCAVALGGALARHELVAVLNGTNASLVLNGLSLLGGRQHGDHHTTIDHAKPHCESHELFNGIFADQARGVFSGRIIVRPDAQRTDSKQTNNNVLLSDQARADSQPQLEIYADDVKCTHGATLGPLDPGALFYLRSRGIGLAEARGLLTYGFGAEVVARVQEPEIRAYLDRLVRAALRATLEARAA